LTHVPGAVPNAEEIIGQEMTTGEKISMLRRRKNITQEQLAEILGVSRQSVSKWEMDQTFPETEKLIRLAGLADASIDLKVMEKTAEKMDEDELLEWTGFYRRKIEEIYPPKPQLLPQSAPACNDEDRAFLV